MQPLSLCNDTTDARRFSFSSRLVLADEYVNSLKGCFTAFFHTAQTMTYLHILKEPPLQTPNWLTAEVSSSAIGWQTTKGDGGKAQNDAKEWNEHRGEAVWNRSCPPLSEKLNVRFTKKASRPPHPHHWTSVSCLDCTVQSVWSAKYWISRLTVIS